MANLLKSSCQPCTSPQLSLRKGLMIRDQDDDVSLLTSDVLVFFSPWMDVYSRDVVHPMLALVAGLLQRGLQVTAFRLEDPSCNRKQRDFTRRLLSSLPCDLQLMENKKKDKKNGKQPYHLITHTEMVPLDICNATSSASSSFWDTWSFTNSTRQKTKNPYREREPYQTLDYVEPMYAAIESAYLNIPQPDLVVVSCKSGFVLEVRNKH